MTADLFPLNHQRLTHARVKFTWLKAEEELLLLCPCCGGKLAIHESAPWHICHGERHCRVSSMTFGRLLNALVEKSEVRP